MNKLVKKLLLVAVASSNGWTSGNFKDESFLPLTVHEMTPTGNNLENGLPKAEFILKNSELFKATEENYARMAVQKQIDHLSTNMLTLEKKIEQLTSRMLTVEQNISTIMNYLE